ncbi:MAG TPA: S9 family peptidase [Gemmatimonadales bacterium]
MIRYVRAPVVIATTLVAAGSAPPSARAQHPHPKPPSAMIKPVQLENLGHVRTDPYYWLRERENPQVIAYLEAENAHTEAVMARTKPLQERLFQEIRDRIKQTDETVPYRLDDYFYYTRYEDGKDYPIHARKRGTLDAPEEVMLDVNQLAQGHTFFAVGGRQVSFGQDLLAFATDTVGRRVYTLRFKNLATGAMLPDEIPQVTGNMAWANDNRTLFYTQQDPETLRWHRVYRHVLGTDPATDQLVYDETDETFSSFVFRTKSKAYVMIASFQTVSSEYRYLDANRPQGTFAVIQPRERDHEYDVDHFGEHFFIRTNLSGATNFRLMRTPVARPARDHWEEVIPHRGDVLLEGIEIFRDHLVLVERARGLRQLRVRPWSGEGEHYLEFGEPAYLTSPAENPTFDTPLLRFNYTSLTTPNSVYDYDMGTRQRVLLKRDEILGGFDQANYQTERWAARAADGAEVPISVVYRKGVQRDGANPLLLYGYGSYGLSMDASFNAPLISLLDRGFVYAIAHVRGGQELGRQWYDNGKLFTKKNTFTDFIACAEYLISRGFTTRERLFAQGGSAGGLLMGAVANLRPDLFAGIVAQVPFVDVVTTMLDASIPLTTSEYDEWGDPNKKDYYDYMLSYSPYDNVEAKAYPHLLVTTGLHDSQVQYWEPAKWVAKLRAMKTDQRRLLLKTNLAAGHGGASARYQRYRDTAFIYAFLLDLVGKGDLTP